MSKKVVLDTNILLETPEILEDNKKSFVITYMTLKELDSLKRKRGDLQYSVRAATRKILEYFDSIHFDLSNKPNGESVDEQIINSAKHHGILYTEDVLMTVLAKVRGVEVYNPLSYQEESYSGCTELEVTEDMGELVNKYYGRPRHVTKGFDADVLVEHLGSVPSETEYIILKYNDSSMIFQYNSDDHTFSRRQLPNRQLKVNGHAIKPFDEYQHIAILSAINMNVPMTIIDGAVGTGKTILSLASALHLKNSHKLNSIYITRPPVGVDPRFNIGFLPGQQNEKLHPWVGGIISNLEFLYEKGAEQVFEENFQHFPVNTAQGYSIHNSVLIVDESQLLSIDLTKQIISRVSQGSKLLLLGDENQNYKVVSRTEMGLRRLKQLIPNPSFEYIRLQTIYRGELAKLSLKL